MFARFGLFDREMIILVRLIPEAAVGLLPGGVEPAIFGHETLVVLSVHRHAFSARLRSVCGRGVLGGDRIEAAIAVEADERPLPCPIDANTGWRVALGIDPAESSGLVLDASDDDLTADVTAADDGDRLLHGRMAACWSPHSMFATGSQALEWLWGHDAARRCRAWPVSLAPDLGPGRRVDAALLVTRTSFCLPLRRVPARAALGGAVATG